MKVMLVSHTVSPLLDCYKNLEDIIAYIARVSNKENQKKQKNNLRLIKFLINNGHWSPFEHCYITVEITTTRDISRQILRHRSFTFQEFSQRYSTPKIAINLNQGRKPAQKNRQASEEPVASEIQEQWERIQQSVAQTCETACYSALSLGISRECARVVLPEGLTETTIYMTGSIRSFMHYLKVRLSKDTQKEHRQIAEEIAKVLEDLIPNIISTTSKS